MRRSSISPVNAVACSQNESWRPQRVMASTGGMKTRPKLNRLNKLHELHEEEDAFGRPREICSACDNFERDLSIAPGSSKTDLARRARTNAAQIAVKRLSAKGSQPAGSKLKG